MKLKVVHTGIKLYCLVASISLEEIGRVNVQMEAQNKVLFGWLVGWLVGWWLVGWLAGWLVGWLVCLLLCF